MPTLLDRDFKSSASISDSRRRPRRRWHILLAIAFMVTTVGIALGPASESSSEAKPLALEASRIETAGETLRRQLPLPTVTPFTDATDLQTAEPSSPVATHEVEIESGDTLSAVFDRLSIPQRELMRFVAFENAGKTMRRLRPGDVLRIAVDPEMRLQGVVYARSEHARIHFDRIDDDFTMREEVDPIETRHHYAQAEIEDSLFLAATGAGLNDGMTMELATIFGWDIDFALDVRRGDEFTVIYEGRYKNGERIGTGSILAAEFTNQGQVFRAIRFTDSEGRTDYYTPDGKSVRKAFLRTPVDFARISSRFSLSRKHPVLNRMRAHRGVDYAAPTGTPVRSTGDGKLEYVGRKGGYGKTIIVRHTSSYSTLYAHLSRFKPGMRSGRRVRQGEIIGYVGKTGLATGPHLHYEFLVNGVQRNPLTIKLPGATPVAEKHRADYEQAAAPILAQLDTISRHRPALELAAETVFD